MSPSTGTPARHVVAFLAITVVLSTVGVVVADDRPAIRFADTTAKAGLIKPLRGMMGHGGAFGDYDGDGHIDLFVGGFCDRPAEEYAPASAPVSSRLLRNMGDGRFQVINKSAASFFGRTSGAVFADLDNDGKLDLYVANNTKGKARRETEPQRSAQLRNVNLFAFRDGKFVDVSTASGACPGEVRTARNIGVFDYDGDGLLDLFVVGDRFTKSPRSYLFRNLGGMRFEDASKAAGIPDDVFGLGLAVADLNGDARPDFFVPHGNRMFISQGDGRYHESESLNRSFAFKPQDGEDWPCGAAFGDLDGDGDLDMVLSIHSTRARNRVYLNEGVRDGWPSFRDITQAAGLGETVPARCPHVELRDFDNDGRVDIYMSAAWRSEDGEVTPLIYRNTGKNKAGLPTFLPPKPIGGPMVYYPAGPSGDYDNDGRIDLFLINWFRGDRSHLLRNVSGENHWLKVRVVGKTFNRMGIGSQVFAYRAGQVGKPEALVGMTEISTGYGYASGQPAVAHFGLGKTEKVDIRVTFPNGKRHDVLGVKVDQMLTIQEPR